MIAFWISAAGLAIGAGMGLYAMINPRWAANLVRLRDDPERPGGFAEFRGTYGGLFFASNSAGLVWLFGSWDYISGAASLKVEADPWIDVPGAERVFPALLVCAAMWFGTAIGRGVSMLADGTATRFNQGSFVFELVLGLVILTPWLIR